MVNVLDPVKNKKGGDLNISASAIETFNRCRRKWYFGYVDRIRGEKNEAAMRGDRIHDLAERYLKGEVDPLALSDEDARWWRFLVPGLEFAPTPEDVAAGGWGVEDWVKEPCGPLNFVGKVDFYHLGDREICDWKTTGNVKWRYSKKPRALAAHIQPRVYAYALFKDDPEAHEHGIQFQHVNMQSKGTPDAMEVWAVHEFDDETTTKYIPWQEILDTWQEVISTSEQMAAVATHNPEAETVEANTKACRDFGACPHAAYCTASPMNRVTPNIPDMSDTVTTKNSKAAAEKVAALRASLGISKAKPAAITPPPKAAPVPTEAPAPISPTDQVRKVLESLGRVPDVVLRTLAKSEWAAVAVELGLTRTGNQWEVAAPTQRNPWKAGTTFRDWEAAGNTSVPEGAKVVAGLLVPEDFDGSASEATLKYSTHAGQRLAAEVLEANDPTPPEPVPAPAPAPAPAPKDLDLRKAARLLIAGIEEASSLDKGAARDTFVTHTAWRRIGDKRHNEVCKAANEWLEAQDMELRIEFDGKEYRQVEDDYYPSQATEREERAKAGGYPLPIPLPPEQVADTITCQDLAEARDEGHAEGYREGYDAAITYEPAYADSEVSPPAPTPTIYVDCMPIGGATFVDFAQWIAEAEDITATEKGVPYYGLVPYNEGVKMVAARAKFAVESGHLPEEMYVDSHHPVAALFIAIVSRTEGVTVVKAVR